MIFVKLFTAFILTIFTVNGYSYGGGGGSSKACTKPNFSDFKPAHLAEAASSSDFSFLASKSTSPSSIEVTVKKSPVNVTIKETSKGYLVSGKIPESTKSKFVRVTINANSTKKCHGSDGWLIKIKD